MEPSRDSRPGIREIFLDIAASCERLDAPKDLPDRAEFAASIVPVRKVATPVLELTEEQRRALPAPVARREERAPEAPPGPARTYPPLEPR